jgi:tetraacyldisaccharide 4'-kinase
MARNALYHAFSAVRILLYPLALLYGAVVWLRNRLYDSGFFSSVEFSTPVIVVGNLSVGGTGKTPHVEYLIRSLQPQFKVATMSRGYKRHTQGFLIADETSNALRIGDEPMQYKLHHPDAVVSVAEDRMTGIPQLLQRRPDVEVVLLDDAFQHRSVKAGLSIVITDYAKPYYADHILPYGTLRESRKASRRADIIVVSKCPREMTPAQADEIVRKLNPEAGQHVFFSTIRYGTPYDFFTREPLNLNGKHALIVCGIAKPGPLEAAVSKLALETHLLSYPDHHYFLQRDLEEIGQAYENWRVDDRIIVTTEKDATRLYLMEEKVRQYGWKIAVMPIVVRFLFDGGGRFEQLTRSYVEESLAEEGRWPREESYF